MGPNDVFSGDGLPARLRPRRVRIADLLFGVAVIAIGLSMLSEPKLSLGQRLFVGLFALVFLGLLGAQWALAGITRTLTRPMISALVGILAAVMALALFTCLFVVGLFFPRIAALLSVVALLQVLYLITWD
jgi:hypothetical protein